MSFIAVCTRTCILEIEFSKQKNAGGNISEFEPNAKRISI